MQGVFASSLLDQDTPLGHIFFPPEVTPAEPFPRLGSLKGEVQEREAS